MTRGQMTAAAAAVLAVVVVGGIVVFRTPHPVAPPVAPPVAGPIAAPAMCLMPGPAPVPPDGNTASQDEMTHGRDILQAFVLQLEAYQKCRDNQADHAGPSVSAQQKADWITDGDNAIDEANAIAKSFSEQIAAFKARAPGH